MIVFLTAPAHGHEVADLVSGKFAANLPEIRAMPYTAALWARNLPRATYIFTDFERLYPWEVRCAADLFRQLTALGLRCLNDPARAMTRFELLRALNRAGINPFNVHRADDAPAPTRFPVFIRAEAAHDEPLTELIPDQAALDAELGRLAGAGWPRRLLLVVEFCAQPIAEGRWRKHGTIRIGEEIFFWSNVIESHWVVKHGAIGLTSAAMFAEEFIAMHANPFAAELRPAFELAGLDYGRADHAPFAGRQVVYEINSHPLMLSGVGEQHSPVRNAGLAHIATRIAAALRAIDTQTHGQVHAAPGPNLPKRLRRNEFLLSRR